MDDQQKLDEMISAFWVSKAIHVAAKLGIADQLKDGPVSISVLAKQSDANEDALYRLLRALASQGVFAEAGPRHFELTPLANLLRRDVPGSKRAQALMAGDEQFRAWAEMEHTIRTGLTAFDQVYGMSLFDYLECHPDKAQIFDEAMVGIHCRKTDEILGNYAFSEFPVICDVGGGNGSQLIDILKAYPHANGMLFDRPHVVDRAACNFAAESLRDRCTLAGGNFFEAITPGADIYILRQIIHDWDDEKALIILQNLYEAVKPGGKILVIDSVIPPGNEPYESKLLDLVMMMIPGGKERTEAEFRELFAKASFELTNIIPTGTEISIIEGIKG